MKILYKNVKKLFFLFFISLLFSCTNLLNDGSNKVSQKNASGDADMTYITISVLGYTDSMANNSRTLLPPAEDGSSVTKYKLYGVLKSTSNTGYEIDESKEELGNWTELSALSSDTIAIIPGTWDFYLYAYKKDGDEEKVYASAKIENTEVGDQSGALNLDFTFSFDDSEFTSGSMSVEIEVPYSQVTKAIVQLYTFNSSNEKVYQTLSKSEYTPSGGSSSQNASFTIEESGIASGYYFLKIDFYTGSADEASASRVQYVKILGGQTTSGDLTYTQLNNSYSITYQDAISDDTDESVSNEDNPTSFNSSTSVSLEDPVCEHYDFAGWYESSDFSGSAISSWSAGAKSGNVTLYAKWTPKVYPVVFYDFAGGQDTGKTYSGTYTDFEESDTSSSGYALSYKSSIPVESFDETANPLSDANYVNFVGWYTSPDCTSDSEIADTDTLDSSFLTDTDGDESGDTLILHAKWNYAVVYVDPASSAGGDNGNRGFSTSEPLLTIDEAKKYMEGNEVAQVVYLLSTASIESASSANNPSGFSDTSTYGAVTNPVIVKRHSTYLDGALFEITTTEQITLSNVTIDGGAVWDESGAAGTNSGLKATAVLIDAYNTDYQTDLLLDENVILQNNANTNSSPTSVSNRGSGILITGTLTSNSKTNQIRTCYSTYGSAIEAVTNSTVNFYKGVIGGSSAADANYSTYAGAALNCDFKSSPTTEGSTVILGAATNASDGSDLVISNNVCGRDGVLVIYGTSSLEAYNITLSNNSGSERSSAFYAGYNSNAKFIGGYISNNDLNSSGTGACLCTDSSSTLSMSGVEISSNTHSNGPASGIFSNSTSDKLILDNVIMSDNTCSGDGGDIYTKGNVYISGESYLGDVYVSSSDVYLYPRNYYDASNTGDTSVSSPLQARSGSYVASITHGSTLPTVEYDEDDTSTYIQLLAETTNGDMSGLHSLFKMNNTTHAINSAGRIILKGSTYDDNISDPSTSQLYFEVDTQTISSTASSPVLTITAYTDSEKTTQATSADSWWCTLLYSGLTDTGAVVNDADSEGAEKTINFYTDDGVNFQAGTYILTIGASLNETAYSDSFTITVE